jgi:hypothetical protein
VHAVLDVMYSLHMTAYWHGRVRQEKLAMTFQYGVCCPWVDRHGRVSATQCSGMSRAQCSTTHIPWPGNPTRESYLYNTSSPLSSSLR